MVLGILLVYKSENLYPTGIQIQELGHTGILIEYLYPIGIPIEVLKNFCVL